jgi:ferritin-like metal-binding protein YciE
MSELKTPLDLFLHELGDILYVEQQLESKVLPQLMQEASDAEIRQGLEKHLRETRGHVENLEQAFELLGEEPLMEECIGFEGLRKEYEELRGEAAPELLDLVGAGAAARSEHYEIAAYETLILMARAMERSDVVPLLEANLKEDKARLQEVESVAKRVAKERVQELTQA